MGVAKKSLGTFVLSGARIRKKPRSSWGRWRLNADDAVLEHTKYSYEVAFTECNSSAEILDWIIQISQKSWATAADIGNLVRALDDVLDIQGHFCGSGKGEESDGEKLAKEYIKGLK